MWYNIFYTDTIRSNAMFFRMLKKDLLSKKSLNIILFIFMIAASVLVFISTADIYSNITGTSRAKEKYKLMNYCLFTYIPKAEREEKLSRLEDIMTQSGEFGKFAHAEGCAVYEDYLDISDFAKKDNDLPSFMVMTPQPRDSSLVYDTEDKPFYVKNNEIALPAPMISSFGANIGDKLRITSRTGEIYEFTVSHFFKDPYTFPTRFIISDSDYETLSTRDFLIYDMYFFDKLPPDGIDPDVLRLPSPELSYLFIMNTYESFDEYHIIADLASVFLALMGVFMILLVFITIRFTVVAEVKEHEKEISIMRAVGVDSVRFRWLFCAKYIAFAVIGGTAGIILGYPAARLFNRHFLVNVPTPSPLTLLLVGLAAVLSLILVTILFSLFVMRRMKRISIMTAIHGETLGERFGSNRVPLLHKNKHIPLPLYLALTDIISKAGRYVFLIITYTLCAVIMLLAVYFRYSVVSSNFLRYGLENQVDFNIIRAGELDDIYEIRETNEMIPYEQQVNEEFEKQGIPAHYEIYMEGDVTVKPPDGSADDAMALFHMKDASAMQYAEGAAPVLINEAAVSHLYAKDHGLKTGDIISIEFDEGLPEEQFVITGLFDIMQPLLPNIIFSPDYEPNGSLQLYTYSSSAVIEQDNKKEVLEQIYELYGRENVMDSKEYIKDYFGSFIPSLDLMMFSLSSAVIIISTLITLLYLNLFLTEDKNDIALLKSLGFRDSTITAWQMLRLLILSGTAMAVGIILTCTLGQQFAQRLTESIVSLTGFRFVSMPIFTFVIMPVLIGMTIIIPSVIRLRKIKDIDLRNINEEM